MRSASPRDGPRRSDETAPIASSFGKKKAGGGGPSAAFGSGGGKERFKAKAAAPDSGYVPAGMGTVKRSTAKSALMGGTKELEAVRQRERLLNFPHLADMANRREQSRRAAQQLADRQALADKGRAQREAWQRAMAARNRSTARKAGSTSASRGA